MHAVPFQSENVMLRPDQERDNTKKEYDNALHSGRFKLTTIPESSLLMGGNSLKKTANFGKLFPMKDEHIACQHHSEKDQQATRDLVDDS